jgi:hypothetical protein
MMNTYSQFRKGDLSIISCGWYAAESHPHEVESRQERQGERDKEEHREGGEEEEDGMEVNGPTHRR